MQSKSVCVVFLRRLNGNRTRIQFSQSFSFNFHLKNKCISFSLNRFLTLTPFSITFNPICFPLSLCLCSIFLQIFFWSNSPNWTVRSIRCQFEPAISQRMQSDWPNVWDILQHSTRDVTHTTRNTTHMNTHEKPVAKRSRTKKKKLFILIFRVAEVN